MRTASTLEPTARQALFLDRMDELRLTHPRNRCARHMTRALFLSLDAIQREWLRATCSSGAENPDSLIGCYILRPDDLHRFADFFDPLIRGRHGVGPAETLDAADGQDADPAGGLASLDLPILSTRARLGRNLQGFNMPANMGRAERIRLEQSMSQVLQGLIDDPAYGGRIYSLTPDFGPDGPNPNLIDAGLYRELVASHLMFANMADDPYMRAAGLARHWPCGRAAYISADRSVVVWIGEEDHLRIISIAEGGDLLATYARLQAVKDRIEAMDGVAFLHDATYGYVTSCPSNLGSGLRASARVILPGLVAPGVDTRAVCEAFGLIASGSPGDRALPGPDGLLDLSPIRRLFIADRDILASLLRGLRGLLAHCPDQACQRLG